jgi:hypothetical protein
VKKEPNSKSSTTTTSKAVVETLIDLGKFHSRGYKFWFENGVQKITFTDVYNEGTVCEATGMFRTTKVIYQCCATKEVNKLKTIPPIY